MGTHATNNEVLDPVARTYNELIESAHDFEKIELFAYAITKYKEALELKPGDEKATELLKKCIAKFNRDNKIIWIILAVAAIVVSLILLF